MVFEPDYTPLPAHTDCFACSDPTGERVKVTWGWSAARACIEGTVCYGRRAQGPPGHVHGGAMASILDEAMGAAAWMSGHVVLLAHLELDYRQMAPIGTALTIQAHVEKVEGRKIHATGTLCLEDGTRAVQARGLFLEVPAEKFQNRVPGTGGPIEEFRQARGTSRSS